MYGRLAVKVESAGSKSSRLTTLEQPKGLEVRELSGSFSCRKSASLDAGSSSWNLGERGGFKSLLVRRRCRVGECSYVSCFQHVFLIFRNRQILRRWQSKRSFLALSGPHTLATRGAKNLLATHSSMRARMKSVAILCQTSAATV
jgi:hypothetical protein